MGFKLVAPVAEGPATGLKERPTFHHILLVVGDCPEVEIIVNEIKLNSVWTRTCRLL